MAELDVDRFNAIARELYRRKFQSIMPESMVQQLQSDFYYGPPPDYVDSEAPSLALELESDVRIWIDGKLNEYAAQAAVGPPVPTDTGVQADEGRATTDMGMTDFLARQKRERERAASSSGLPAWAWGAIAAALVVAVGFGARRGARG